MINSKEHDMPAGIFVLALVQGVYFLITGIWPILHISSFVAVTGPKTDLWLVKTVGMLVLVIGVGLTAASLKRQITFPLVLIASGTAAGFFLIDVIYFWLGELSVVYLLDAVLELLFFIGWGYLIIRSGLFVHFIES